MKIYLKLLQEGILFALEALWANKLRTFLSLLGITIGIFAVIAVFSFVDSWEARIKDSLASLGNEVVYVQKWPWSFGSDYPWWKYMARPLPTYKEYQYMQGRSELAEVVCFMGGLNGKTIKYEKNDVTGVSVFAATHEYDKIRDFEIGKGRYFSYSESTNGSAVVIVGSNIDQQLFQGSDPLGKEIWMLGKRFRIIGVFKQEGNNALNTSTDNQVLMPMNFFRKIVDIRDEGSPPLIAVKGKPSVQMDELKEELRSILRSYRRIKPIQEDNFALNQISLMANQLSALTAQISIIGWIIGGFSILVGGFGIANIMFVSVHERTGLIGIQKALGAKRFFILFQFLVESVILSLIGGLLGLILVYLMTLIATKTADMTIFLSLKNILLGLFVSAIIGIVSGLAPALRASRMDPVEAIRQG